MSSGFFKLKGGEQKIISRTINNIQKATKALTKDPNSAQLRYVEIIPELLNKLETCTNNKNIADLRTLINLYRANNVMIEGDKAYNTTIWNYDIAIKGKAVTIEELMNKLEESVNDIPACIKCNSWNVVLSGHAHETSLGHHTSYDCLNCGETFHSI